MKPHEQLADDDRDRAAHYAVDGLEADAVPMYEAHLAVCPLCRAEVSVCRDTFQALGRSLPPVAPPASLRGRLIAEVLRNERRETAQPVQAWKQWLANEPGEPSVIVRATDGGWQETAVAGIRVRRLFVDQAADRITMLVRMEAETSYPAHRHGGVEECFVLEGDLYGPDFEMKAGDYQRLEGGSTHGIQGTRAGCLLFIVSSMQDELVERGDGAQT